MARHPVLALALLSLACTAQYVTARNDPAVASTAAPNSLSCYNSVGNGMVTPMVTYQDDRDPIMCASYEFLCTKNDINEDDVSCTPAEVASGVWKPFYEAADARDCQEKLKRPGQYRNVVCCDTPDCNKPDAKAIKTATTSTPVTTDAAAPTAAPTAAADTAPGASAGGLSCYHNMGNTVTPITKYQDNDDREPLVCASYQFKCSYRDVHETDINEVACTPAEAASGAWKWRYEATDASNCAKKKLDSSFHRSVTCCDTNNCNKPDPALDKNVVVSAAPGATATTAAPASSAEQTPSGTATTTTTTPTTSTADGQAASPTGIAGSSTSVKDAGNGSAAPTYVASGASSAVGSVHAMVAGAVIALHWLCCQ